jgi:hypothetical protein
VGLKGQDGKSHGKIPLKELAGDRAFSSQVIDDDGNPGRGTGRGNRRTDGFGRRDGFRGRGLIFESSRGWLV